MAARFDRCSFARRRIGAVLVGVAALAASGGAQAAKAVEGPWFNARVGTRIVYRVTEPSRLPGVKARERTVTEEATSVTDAEVTLRVVQRTACEADRTSTRKVPRTISEEQYAAAFHSWGFVRASPPMTVSGHEFRCSAFEKDIDLGNGETTRQRTTICRELPGWIYRSTVGGEDRFRMLEYVP